MAPSKQRNSRFRRLQHAFAGGALRVGGGQFRAHAVQLPAHLLENRIVPPGGVPHLEFVAKFFQRSAIAFVECVLRFAQLGDDAIGGFFDPLFD